MKRLLAWLMGGVALAGLLVSLWLPAAAQAADRRNVADDKIAESAGKLVFSYGGSAKFSLDSSGNLITTSNITAYGTP